MPDRLFAPQLAIDSSVELIGGEAHHLARVLRAKPGDEVELFDGRGRSAWGKIVELGKKSVTLRIEGRIAEEKPAAPVIIGAAVPKGERLRWLVEKATELGVDRLVPLETARGVVHPRDGKLDKLQQTVIAACKQSGRNRLMEIDASTAWDDFIVRDFQGRCVLVAHPSGEPLARMLTGESAQSPVVAAIGPEGGFTDAEIEAAIAAGAKLVSLGPRILRIETAVIAMAAAITAARQSECRGKSDADG